MKIKPLDIIMVTLLVIISIYPLFQKNSGKKHLYLLVDDKKIELSFKKKIIDLKASFNKNIIIEIDEKKARILKSNCPLQICVKTGWISNCNDATVCIPNRVALIIECEESEYDAISK
ncbi:NusG domain II-containing protein [Deferribacter autotrophicus]|uniref:NusG domain II-containing protein n=1 Tax=Deferribacter autotrophicus TaxID=500465 RepID=A0A5A8F0U6_9BACT|nr:NusG domain II-containing protein [Deferribacter autotrophicus]KAA0256880.1 NusG domain II-containing protein [Deferribacter autotrophicus]